MTEYAVSIEQWNKLVEEKFALKDEIKSLESRLKEEIEERDRLFDLADKHRCRVFDLEQRLSQAEADSKLDRENYVKLWKDYSNLMDVAGKMARCVDFLARHPVKCVIGIDGSDPYTQAKNLLAEWDGIK